jgi:hypothetical protein
VSGRTRQPRAMTDSVSDWWNFGASAGGTIGTVIAVRFSIVSANRARADACEAHEESKRANIRTAVAERQTLELQKESERERRAYQQRVDAEERARRQAAAVSMTFSWTKVSSGPGVIEVDRDHMADVTLYAHKGSAQPTEDIRLSWLVPTYSVPYDAAHIAQLQGVSAGPTINWRVEWWGDHWEDKSNLVLVFTDAFDDTGQLNGDRTLLLLAPRPIVPAYPSAMVAPGNNETAP